MIFPQKHFPLADKNDTVHANDDDDDDGECDKVQRCV